MEEGSIVQKKKTAQKMILPGFPLQHIAELLELSLEEVQSLYPEGPAVTPLKSLLPIIYA
jgi:hypothetical protein